MPKKSKSSKKKKSSKTHNLRSSEATNNPEIKVIGEPPIDEGAIASNQPENCDLKTSAESTSGIIVFYGSSFELNKTPTPSENSDSGIPFSATLSREKSKSVESLARSKLVKPSLRRILSTPSLSSVISDEKLESLLLEFVLSRRPHFELLFRFSHSAAEYMENLTSIRKDNAENKIVRSNRWKQKDSSDWFDFLFLWDTMPANIKMFKAVLRYTYKDFDTEKRISATLEEFYSLVEDIADIFNSLDELLQLSRNCYPKFSRFCSCNNESTFLRSAADFRRHLNYFYKKIKIELDKFMALSDLTTQVTYV